MSDKGMELWVARQTDDGLRQHIAELRKDFDDQGSPTDMATIAEDYKLCMAEMERRGLSEEPPTNGSAERRAR